MNETGYPSVVEQLESFIRSLEERRDSAQQDINETYQRIGRLLAKKESAEARIAEAREVIALVKGDES